MVSTSVFSPWLQDYLWEGKRKVNTVHYTLKREDKSRGKPKADLGQEPRRDEDGLVHTAAIVPAVLCRKAALAGCWLPDTGQEYSLQAPCSPAGPQLRSQLQERQDRRQSPRSSQLSPTAGGSAGLRGGQSWGTELGSLWAQHDSSLLTSSLTTKFVCLCCCSSGWKIIVEMAKFVRFLRGYLFNFSSLMSQGFSTIHKISILHVLGDLKHVYWALFISNGKYLVNNNN